MMLPELQEEDITEFDIPKYGQELSFGGYDVEEMIATEELGAVEPDFGPGRSGAAKLKAWRKKEALKKKTSKPRFSISKLAELARSRGKLPPKKAPLSIIRSKTSSVRRFPTPRPRATKAEKIQGVVERGVTEYRQEQAQKAGLRPEQARLAKQDALNSIAGRIRADLMPKLNAIYNMLDKSKVQTMATDEHNVIMNTQAYRRKVLGDLVRISRRVPRKTSSKNGRRRSLGLF